MSGYGANGKGTPIADEAREDFLALIRDGEVRHLAAKQVGETSTRFRSLIRRDVDFRQRYLDALIASGRPDDAVMAEVEAQEKMQMLERLFDEYLERALDPKAGSNGSSNRALQNLLTLTHDVFKPFLEARMHRHIHSGAVGVFAMPQIDTAKWSLEEQQEFVRINARREELLAKARPDDAPEQMPYELAAVSAGDDVVDDDSAVELPGE